MGMRMRGRGESCEECGGLFRESVYPLILRESIHDLSQQERSIFRFPNGPYPRHLFRDPIYILHCMPARRSFSCKLAHQGWAAPRPVRPLGIQAPDSYWGSVHQ